MEKQSRVLKFPEGFLWGTATSAHQVEGENTNNDWWQWEQTQERIADGVRSGLACNHYQLYQSDFDMARQLGHNAHRFSLEWSRIEPRPGEYNQEAIDHYKTVIFTLKQRGITTLVTLFHFTLPIWVAKLGGFENPEIVPLFQRYATKVAQELGQDIDYWLTLNEPMVYLYKGYIQKIWPPGRNIGLKIFRVLRNMLQAHKQAYQAIHCTCQDFVNKKSPLVGFSKYMRIFSASRNYNPFDRLVAAFKDYLFNDYVLNAIASSRMKAPLDFIGLNYYTRELTRFNPLKPAEFFRESKISQGSDISDLGWEIYPPGIYLALCKLKRYEVPIIITENGLADKQDKRRSQFIINHLIQAHQAIEEGVDVRGYLYWSLLDNFEWTEGFRARFGLAEVDYATQKRTLRPSAYTFANICKTNQIFLRDSPSK